MSLWIIAIEDLLAHPKYAFSADKLRQQNDEHIGHQRQFNISAQKKRQTIGEYECLKTNFDNDYGGLFGRAMK